MIKPFGFGKLLNYLDALKIDSARCIKNKSPLARCNLCANVCPLKGLSFYNGEWEVSKCTLCGRCVNLCPCEVYHIDEKALLEQAPSKHLVLTCQNDRSTNYGLKLSCFKALGPELIFYLLRRHEKLSLVVSSKVCALCENEFSAEVLKLLLKRYHLPLENLFFVTEESDVNRFEGSLESSRRAYLTGAYKRILNHSADVAIEEMADIDLVEKEALPLKRQLLYQAYKNDELNKDGETLPYPILEAKRCHFCGACEKLCPEEAIKIVEKEDEKYLLFQPVLCHFCRLCEEICMTKGLSWGEYLTKEAFFSAKWHKVAEAKERRCTSCGQHHYSHEGDALCYFCRQKK